MGIDNLLIIIVLVSGMYMLWNIGANDVANAMGTSVGSKALTLRKAVFLAAILEFSGAFVLGSNVSETIQNGIVDPRMFEQDPMIFILGMIASLIATALWLQIATFFRWPVSTTHAIVGAVLGFGAVVGGFEAVKWDMVGSIALSWVISPALSGLIAYFFFTWVQKQILYSVCPVTSTVKIAPYLLAIVAFTMLVSLGSNGIKNVNLSMSITYVLVIALIISILSYLVAKFFLCRFPVKQGMAIQSTELQGEQLHAIYKATKHLSRFKTTASEPYLAEVNRMMNNLRLMAKEIKAKPSEESHISNQYQIVEKIFAYLQIVSACCVAFAHGANDVANAIGPVAAVVEMVKNPLALNSFSPIPTWLLAMGGVGIVVGLATYGWRVIETIGEKITVLTPTRGFCAEFGAATSILIASKLGFPISTTQCVVGAVLGVGLARGLSALNLRVLRDIFISWIITLPSSAIATVLIYYLLSVLLGSYQLYVT
jgi:phosphate/sulfate permease